MDNRHPNTHHHLQKAFSESVIEHHKKEKEEKEVDDEKRSRLIQSAPATPLTTPKQRVGDNKVGSAIMGGMAAGYFVAIFGPLGVIGGGVVAAFTYFTNRMNQRAQLKQMALDTNVTTRIKFNKIQPKNMIGGENGILFDLPERISKRSDSYYLGFVTKIGFADLIGKKSPLTHSSLIFVPADEMEKMQKMDVTKRDKYAEENEELFFVVGRQSPVFRKKNNAKNAVAEEVQIAHAGSKSMLYTVMEAENNYDLFPGTDSVANMTNGIFTAKEINDLINKTNIEICFASGQTCTMYGSNCYSASIYLLASAIEVIHNRETNENYTVEMANADIADLGMLLLDVARNNLGEGVFNNPKVAERINLSLAICESRNLIKKDVDHGQDQGLSSNQERSSKASVN